jgi:hypothetical protein
MTLARRSIGSRALTGSTPGRDLLTVAQAAAFLRVRPADLMAAVRARDVPFHVRRHTVLFCRSELLARMQHRDPSTTGQREARS